jgi:hypothetical protein
MDNIMCGIASSSSSFCRLGVQNLWFIFMNHDLNPFVSSQELKNRV